MRHFHDLYAKTIFNEYPIVLFIQYQMILRLNLGAKWLSCFGISEGHFVCDFSFRIVFFLIFF